MAEGSQGQVSAMALSWNCARRGACRALRRTAASDERLAGRGLVTHKDSPHYDGVSALGGWHCKTGSNARRTSEHCGKVGEISSHRRLETALNIKGRTRLMWKCIVP